MEQLFSNITWAIGQGDNVADEKILRNWNHPSTNIYVTLSLFVLMRVSRKGKRGGGGARVTLFVIMRVSRKGQRGGGGRG